MSKTASYIKDRYNAKTYDRYTFYLRKDDALNECLQAEKAKQAFSQTVKDALSMFYLKAELNKTEDIRPKKVKPPPEYGTKRQRRAATKNIIKQLEQIKAAEEISHDNTPENLQGSEAYEIAESCISALDEAIETLSSAY